MQRCAAFLQHFTTCDFSSIQASRNLNLNTFSTGTHRVGDSLLDGAAISDLALNLASDIGSNDRSVKLRTLNLEDVDLNLLVEELLQLILQVVNILSTLTNDDTRTSRADSYGNQLQCALDDNLLNAGLGQTLVEVLADLLILYQVVTEVLASEPI